MKVIDTSAWIEWLAGRQMQATLLTCDAHFEGLPSVDFIRKA
jgi:predicted nucleic acid-binding protein